MIPRIRISEPQEPINPFDYGEVRYEMPPIVWLLLYAAFMTALCMAIYAIAKDVWGF